VSKEHVQRVLMTAKRTIEQRSEENSRQTNRRRDQFGVR